MIAIESEGFDRLHPETRALVERAISTFAYGVVCAAQRGASDELLKEIIAMGGAIQHVAALGSGEEPMSPSTKYDLETCVIGARMVFTPGRERFQPPVEELGRINHMTAFLDLVERRVGKFDSEDVTQVRLHARLNEGQKEWISVVPRI